MLGNVYEWVLDRYYNKYDDTTDTVEEPVLPNASSVARGGAWTFSAKNARVSNRREMLSDGAELDVGFRCAMSDGSN
jgi:formylglycine-generating enzyme required for sulfatase activity